MLTIILIFLIVYSVVLKKIMSKENLQYYRDIPSDDAPAYIGKIIKGHVNGNDIIATILDLKEKGYIEIKKKTQRKLFFRCVFFSLRIRADSAYAAGRAP